jgi:formate dehydrogenase iron-sulfur subunit
VFSRNGGYLAEGMGMGKALLIDTTLCIGCDSCVEACKEANGLPPKVDDRLTAYTWTTLSQHGDDVYCRHLCMHCVHPTCVSVCPVGALEKTPEGPVIYHEDRCIGCRYCMVACPFNIPKYEWDKTLPRVQKCIMCDSRLARGESTACAEACPTGATMFGEREQLLEEGRRRLRERPDAYVGGIYGEKEAGGTGVLFMSSVDIGQLGFPEDLTSEPLPALTWRALSKIPDIVSVGGLFLFGLWWVINRRMEAQRVELQAVQAPDRGADR